MTESAKFQTDKQRVRSAAITFMAADDAYNNAKRKTNKLDEAMMNAYDEFVDAIGFGFAANEGDVARLVRDLTE